jgi:hemolysin activation/secretion protein
MFIVVYGLPYVPKNNLSLTDIYFVLTQSMPSFLNCTAILHFVNLVLLLGNKYKYLNSELESSALTPRNVTNQKFCNTNYVTPVENYTFRMKPSVTELRENCMSSRRKHVRNLRIIYSSQSRARVKANRPIKSNRKSEIALQVGSK